MRRPLVGDHARRLAERRGRGGVDQTRNAGLLGGLHGGHGAADVGRHHRRRRRSTQNLFKPATLKASSQPVHRCRQRAARRQIAASHLDPTCGQHRRAASERASADDLVAALEQRRDQSAADQPGSAADEDLATVQDLSASAERIR